MHIDREAALDDPQQVHQPPTHDGVGREIRPFDDDFV
jgi:hypothetical protein